MVKKTKTFEESLSELEAIVQKLERGMCLLKKH